MSRILVVGDAMLDRYLYGNCFRLSPEAPVPIMRVTGHSMAPGGACNTALNVQSLGVDCALVSVVGQDEAGKDLVSTLQSQLSHFHLQQCRIKTTVKTRHMVGAHHLLRIDSESECPIDQLRDVLKYIDSYIQDVDWMIFSDYGKHFQRLAPEIIRIANKAAVPIAVDPKSSDWNIYRGADLITPNLAEMKSALPKGSVGQQALKELGIKELLVTEGGNGMTHYSQKRKKSIHRDAISQEVIDPCGAGDTAVASFVVGKVRGWTTEQCMEYANESAGQVCQKVGTHTAKGVAFPEGIRKVA